jgi:hypothetical protein
MRQKLFALVALMVQQLTLAFKAKSMLSMLVSRTPATLARIEEPGGTPGVFARDKVSRVQLLAVIR